MAGGLRSRGPEGGREGRVWRHGGCEWAEGVVDGRHGRHARPTGRHAPGQPADLLQGVRDTNSGFQGKQSEKLNDMYRKSGGKGGVGAGDAF